MPAVLPDARRILRCYVSDATQNKMKISAFLLYIKRRRRKLSHCLIIVGFVLLCVYVYKKDSVRKTVAKEHSSVCSSFFVVLHFRIETKVGEVIKTQNLISIKDKLSSYSGKQREVVFVDQQMSANGLPLSMYRSAYYMQGSAGMEQDCGSVWGFDRQRQEVTYDACKNNHIENSWKFCKLPFRTVTGLTTQTAASFNKYCMPNLFASWPLGAVNRCILENERNLTKWLNYAKMLDKDLMNDVVSRAIGHNVVSWRVLGMIIEYDKALLSTGFTVINVTGTPTDESTQAHVLSTQQSKPRTLYTVKPTILARHNKPEEVLPATGKAQMSVHTTSSSQAQSDVSAPKASIASETFMTFMPITESMEYSQHEFVSGVPEEITTTEAPAVTESEVGFSTHTKRTDATAADIPHSTFAGTTRSSDEDAEEDYYSLMRDIYPELFATESSPIITANTQQGATLYTDDESEGSGLDVLLTSQPLTDPGSNEIHMISGHINSVSQEITREVTPSGPEISNKEMSTEYVTSADVRVKDIIPHTTGNPLVDDMLLFQQLVHKIYGVNLTTMPVPLKDLVEAMALMLPPESTASTDRKYDDEDGYDPFALEPSIVLPVLTDVTTTAPAPTYQTAIDAPHDHLHHDEIDKTHNDNMNATVLKVVYELLMKHISSHEHEQDDVAPSSTISQLSNYATFSPTSASKEILANLAKNIITNGYESSTTSNMRTVASSVPDHSIGSDVLATTSSNEQLPAIDRKGIVRLMVTTAGSRQTPAKPLPTSHPKVINLNGWTDVSTPSGVVWSHMTDGRVDSRETDETMTSSFDRLAPTTSAEQLSGSAMTNVPRDVVHDGLKDVTAVHFASPSTSSEPITLPTSHIIQATERPRSTKLYEIPGYASLDIDKPPPASASITHFPVMMTAPVPDNTRPSWISVSTSKPVTIKDEFTLSGNVNVLSAVDNSDFRTTPSSERPSELFETSLNPSEPLAVTNPTISSRPRTEEFVLSPMEAQTSSPAEDNSFVDDNKTLKNAWHISTPKMVIKEHEDVTSFIHDGGSGTDDARWVNDTQTTAVVGMVPNEPFYGKETTPPYGQGVITVESLHLESTHSPLQTSDEVLKATRTVTREDRPGVTVSASIFTPSEFLEIAQESEKILPSPVTASSIADVVLAATHLDFMSSGEPVTISGDGRFPSSTFHSGNGNLQLPVLASIPSTTTSSSPTFGSGNYNLDLPHGGSTTTSTIDNPPSITMVTGDANMELSGSITSIADRISSVSESLTMATNREDLQRPGGDVTTVLEDGQISSASQVATTVGSGTANLKLYANNSSSTFEYDKSESVPTLASGYENLEVSGSYSGITPMDDQILSFSQSTTTITTSDGNLQLFDSDSSTTPVDDQILFMSGTAATLASGIGDLELSGTDSSTTTVDDMSSFVGESATTVANSNEKFPDVDSSINTVDDPISMTTFANTELTDNQPTTYQDKRPINKTIELISGDGNPTTTIEATSGGQSLGISATVTKSGVESTSTQASTNADDSSFVEEIDSTTKFGGTLHTNGQPSTVATLNTEVDYALSHDPLTGKTSTFPSVTHTSAMADFQTPLSGPTTKLSSRSTASQDFVSTPKSQRVTHLQETTPVENVAPTPPLEVLKTHTEGIRTDPIVKITSAILGKWFEYHIPATWTDVLRNEADSSVNIDIARTEDNQAEDSVLVSEKWLTYEEREGIICGVPVPKNQTSMFQISTFSISLNVDGRLHTAHAPILLHVSLYTLTELSRPDYEVMTNVAITKHATWRENEDDLGTRAFLDKLSTYIQGNGQIAPRDSINILSYQTSSKTRKKRTYGHGLTSVQVIWNIDNTTFNSFSSHYSGMMLEGEGKPSPNLFMAMLPEFIITNISISYKPRTEGSYGRAAQSATVEKRSFGLLTIIPPALIGILLILSCVKLMLMQRQRGSVYRVTDRLLDKTFGPNRKPIYLNNEVEMDYFRPSRARIVANDCDSFRSESDNTTSSSRFQQDGTGNTSQRSYASCNSFQIAGSHSRTSVRFDIFDEDESTSIQSSSVSIQENEEYYLFSNGTFHTAP